MNNSTGNNDQIHCDNLNIIWPSIIGSFLVAWVSVLLIILFFEYMISCPKRRSEPKRDCLSNTRWTCGFLVSSETKIGKFLVALHFVFSFISVSIYIWLTAKYSELSHGDAFCSPWFKEPLLVFDFLMHIYFLLFLICQFVDSKNFFKFWFSSSTFVEVATITSQFVMLILNVHVIAMRYLRIIRLSMLVDILVFIKVIRSEARILLTNLLIEIVVIWLTASGIMKTLENFGDFWAPVDKINAQNLSYFDSLYFSIVTLTTVGYGDISPVTTFGRVFLIFFVLYALGTFAASLPVIAETMSELSEYDGYYNSTCSQGHIIVAGHITYDSITSFLKDFLHADRRAIQRNLKILFLGHFLPNLQLQAFLKRHSLTVQYFRGKVSNARDCSRVSLNSANCVIILTNLKASNPKEEDWTRIMEVLSVKDKVPTIRVIVQLNIFANKFLLRTIPNWLEDSSINSDVALCYSELRLGIMAQNCLAPGFSTLISNIVTMQKTYSLEMWKTNQWHRNYVSGGVKEIYSSTFSSEFHGMKFSNAVRIGMMKLNLLLLGVSIGIHTDSTSDSKFSNNCHYLVNPHDLLIDSYKMEALVIADDEFAAERLKIYCSICHTKDLPNLDSRLEKCHRNHHEKGSNNKYVCNEVVNDCQTYQFSLFETDPVKRKAHRKEMDEMLYSNDKLRHHKLSLGQPKSTIFYDFSGLFYWAPSRPIEEAIYEPDMNFRDHIVVCVLTHPNSSPIGLYSFVLPLRSTTILPDNLKKIVFLGDIEYLKKEWHSIQNFPNIYVFNGSPLNRAHLYRANISRCKSCVILANIQITDKNDDFILWDKEAILSTLNVKSLKFAGDEETISLIGERNILVTELYIAENCDFLEEDDAAISEVFEAQPFVTGRMFNADVLNSLISMAFFNPSAIGFLRHIVTGGSTGETEELLTTGQEIPAGCGPELKYSGRCRLKYLSLKEDPLRSLLLDIEIPTFIDLFLRALESEHMICLGLFRHQYEQIHENKRRYVYMFPKKNEILKESDMVYCFTAHHSQGKKLDCNTHM